MRRTTFKNHEQHAISGRGPEITDCLIQNNPTGYISSPGGFMFKRNVLNNNGVAMDLRENPGQIEENNVCNTRQWNVFCRQDVGISLENNYWGEPSGNSKDTKRSHLPISIRHFGDQVNISSVKMSKI